MRQFPDGYSEYSQRNKEGGLNMEYVLICVAVVMFLGIVVAPMICIEVIDNMTKGYSNKDFIDHLAEDFHSEVGIRIYDEK